MMLNASYNLTYVQITGYFKCVYCVCYVCRSCSRLNICQLLVPQKHTTIILLNIQNNVLISTVCVPNIYVIYNVNCRLRN